MKLISSKYRNKLIASIKTSLENYETNQDLISVYLRYKLNKLTERDLHIPSVKFLSLLSSDISEATKYLRENHGNVFRNSFEGFSEILLYLFSTVNMNIELFREVERISHHITISFLYLLPNNYPCLDEIIYRDICHMKELTGLRLALEALKPYFTSEINSILTESSISILKNLETFTVVTNADTHRHQDLFRQISPQIQEVYKLVGKSVRILDISIVVHIHNPYLFDLICQRVSQLELRLISLHACFGRASTVYQYIMKKYQL